MYNSEKKVTWFISVTKIDDWTKEKFDHEYLTIHAEMTARGAEVIGLPQAYTQVDVGVSKDDPDHPGWDYVTCLQWPHTACIYEGFSNPQYKATAGQHVFCRLDQKGCIAEQVAEAIFGAEPQSADTPQVFVFHRRSCSDQNASEIWLQSRQQMVETLSKQETSLYAYTLWRDMTPNDTAIFFADTQFSGGSWLEFYAVERFTFTSLEAAKGFVQGKRRSIVEDGKAFILFGHPRRVV